MFTQIGRGQTILRVDASASDPSPDGSTWVKAFPHLQDALVAVGGVGTTQIWVAEGTYMPDGGRIPPGGSHSAGSGDRAATFQLASNVEIYGGFPTGGGDGTFNARNEDPDTNGTVLSGDLANDDGPVFANNAENSNHVTVGSNTDASAILDGFTITAGNAFWDQGGARSGGGMRNEDGSPTVSHCAFYRNSAESVGAGMYTKGVYDLTVTACTFIENNGSGMLVRSFGSTATITDCTFIDNIRSEDHTYGGGGLMNSGADV
jgi:hypothetical protein